MDIVLADPAVAGLGSSVGASGFNASVNRGRHVHQPEAARPARRRHARSAVVARLRAQAHATSPASASSWCRRRICASAGGRAIRNISSRCGAPTSTRCRPGCRSVLDRVKQMPASSTSPPTANRAACRPISSSTARPRRGSACASRTSTTRSTTPSRSGRFRPSTARATSTASSSRSTANTRATPTTCRQIYRRPGSGGSQVPLSAVAHVERGIAPLVVNHQGQFPSVDHHLQSGARRARSSRRPPRIQQAVARNAHPRRRSTPISPATCSAFQQSVGAQPLLILAALIAVYIVLGVLYESLAHPLTIISTLPSAGLGALLALQIVRHRAHRDRLHRHHSADRHRQEERHHDGRLRARRRTRRGLPPEQAIHEACLERFRPILMTTMAAMLGALPLVIATGPGSELRRPLGITIIGGLAGVAGAHALHDAGDLSAARPAAPQARRRALQLHAPPPDAPSRRNNALSSPRRRGPSNRDAAIRSHRLRRTGSPAFARRSADAEITRPNTGAARPARRRARRKRRVHTTRPRSIRKWRSATRISAPTFLSITRIDSPLCLEPRQAAPDLGADQRRQALGRLVEDQQPRIGHQRAADRQHLLLAAGELIAHAAAALGQRAETARRPAPASSRRRAATAVASRFSRTDEIRENLPAFRHQPDAALRDAVRRRARGSPRPSKRIAPARAGVSPMIERTVVVLPMPLRPISVTISPGAIASDTPNSTWLRP